MNLLRNLSASPVVALASFLLGATPFPAAETITSAPPPKRSSPELPSARPAHWAVKSNLPGVPNFHRVTTNLYRGAQPTAEGVARLKAMGIRTVVNLRAFHSDKDELAGSELKGKRLSTKPWHGETDDVVRFLKIVSDTNNLPGFVHCQRGADRTGVMCAMYRIAVCGWTKQEAIKEMTHGGFGFSPTWQNLIRFVERADIADIKRRAGIKSGNRQSAPAQQEGEAATTSPDSKNK